ncbi:MAG TPA: CheR family methyltransferase [Kofleriaceae bacterium]
MSAPALAELIERTTGLAINRGGVSTALDRFVTERMRVLGMTTLESYIALAADPTGTEQKRLIDAITVPHTWFYRDPEQLRAIERLMNAAPSGPIAIWVAGCATGEEAYTLAMIGRSVGRELYVLATDINETALAAARRGVYSPLAVRDVPDPERRRYLVPTDGGFAMDPALQSTVVFMRHNLVEPAPSPPRGAWDLVVCRNVLIYFSPGAARRLLGRFARAVREGGALVVGAGEVVFEPPVGLELVSSGNRLVLRRPPRAALAPPPAIRTAPPPQVPAPVPAPEPIAKPTPPRPTRNDDMISALTRGHGLFERGEITAAIEIYDQLSRAHPDIAEVWLFLGIAHYHRGAVEEAAHALRASLCLDTSLWPAGFFLARAYERLGRRDDASQQYDLLADDELQPLALQSTSAVINELRALRHDFRNAARRLATELPRRPIR